VSTGRAPGRRFRRQGGTFAEGDEAMGTAWGNAVSRFISQADAEGSLDGDSASIWIQTFKSNFAPFWGGPWHMPAMALIAWRFGPAASRLRPKKN